MGDRQDRPSARSLGLNDRGEELLSDRDVHSFAICLVKRQDACRPSAEIDEDFVAADRRDDVCEQLFHGLWVDGHPRQAGKGHATKNSGLLPPTP